MLNFFHDHDVDFDFQLEKMDEEVGYSEIMVLKDFFIIMLQAKFDVGKFLSLINDQHKETRRYKCSKDGLEEVKRVKRELKQIDRDANFW